MIFELTILKVIDTCLRYIRLPFRSNRILIIRLDSVGDYILFRNFLPGLKQSPAYRKCKFTLLGNQAFETLAAEYDKEIFNDFIWINPKILFGKNNIAKTKLAIKLKLRRFDILINPCHSKIVEVENFLSKIGAKEIIGSVGDDGNSNSVEEYKATLSNYTQLINVPNVDCFEFFRNEAFFAQLMGLNKLRVELRIPSTSTQNNVSTIVIVPGAGANFRRWATSNFSSVINLVNKNINFPIRFVITGTQDETDLAQQILAGVDEGIQILDLTGKLNLLNFIDEIKAANLVLSNETSAVHIAAATKTAAICISNGNHFGRFNPYPSSLSSNIFTFYPDEAFYLRSLKDQLVEKCRKESTYNIDEVKFAPVAEKVINLVIKSNSAALN